MRDHERELRAGRDAALALQSIAELIVENPQARAEMADSIQTVANYLRAIPVKPELEILAIRKACARKEYDVAKSHAIVLKKEIHRRASMRHAAIESEQDWEGARHFLPRRMIATLAVLALSTPACRIEAIAKSALEILSRDFLSVMVIQIDSRAAR